MLLKTILIFKFQNLNFMCGPVNHAEYAQNMFGMATLSEILEHFER